MVGGWSNFTQTQKRLSVISAAVVAICGGIVAVPPAWSTLGLPEIATKVYVKMEIDSVKMAQKTLDQSVGRLEIAIGSGRQGQIKQEQNRIKAEIARTTDENYKSTLRENLDDLNVEAQELNAKLRELRTKQ